jgi:hypothetical protein
MKQLAYLESVTNILSKQAVPTFFVVLRQSFFEVISDTKNCYNLDPLKMEQKLTY